MVAPTDDEASKKEKAPAASAPEEKKEEEPAEEAVSDNADFADEKQKMLNDLRTRMEKAKKNGQSL